MNTFLKKTKDLVEIDTFIKPWIVIIITLGILILIFLITSTGQVLQMAETPTNGGIVKPIPEAKLRALIKPTQIDNVKGDIIYFAMAVSAFCLLISALVLIISLPIYFWSANEIRSKKAGKLVKSSFSFIVVSGGGVIGTLGFSI